MDEDEVTFAKGDLYMRPLLLAIGFLVLPALVIGCAGSPESTSALMSTTTTPTTTSTPTLTPTLVNPTPAHPDTGTIIGQVLYVDGTPASGVIISLFDINAYLSRDWTTADNNGDYRFDFVPAGKEYDIFAFASLSSGEPDAVVTVMDQQTTTVPTITTPRDIDNIRSGELNASDPNTYAIVSAQPSFSWDVVPDASFYVITIDSTPIGYSLETTVTNNSITWSMLQAGSYELTIDAYNTQSVLVGKGYGWFTVQP
jgi:hypothetical protein